MHKTSVPIDSTDRRFRNFSFELTFSIIGITIAEELPPTIAPKTAPINRSNPKTILNINAQATIEKTTVKTARRRALGLLFAPIAFIMILFDGGLKMALFNG